MVIKKCIIIHGSSSDVEKAMDPEKRTYDKHWIPWAKKQLIENGIETETPLIVPAKQIRVFCKMLF